MLGFVVLQIKNSQHKTDNSKMYKENLNLKSSLLNKEVGEYIKLIKENPLEKERFEKTVQNIEKELEKVNQELDEFRQIEQEQIDKHYNGRGNTV